MGNAPVLDAQEVVETTLRAVRRTSNIRHAEEAQERSSAVRILVANHRQVCGLSADEPSSFRAVLARDGRFMSGSKRRGFKAGDAGVVRVLYAGNFKTYNFIPDLPVGSKSYRISRGAFQRV